MLESTGYPNRLLVNFQSEFHELDSRTDSLPSSKMCILMEDSNHRSMLCLYYATCSYNLEISDLVITDSLNIDCMVSHLDDTHVCTSYTPVCTLVNEGTGFVRLVFTHHVGKASVGLTGPVGTRFELFESTCEGLLVRHHFCD